jgi:RimJ/RimL family protein N-acetyltransferase
VQHSISLTCLRYRLRPVTLEDAGFIVALRTDPVLNRFVHEISPRVDDQVEWLKRYSQRAGDYYFIVEDVDTLDPHGTIGLYNLESGSAEWGRWIIKHGSLAALESAWLICEVAFSTLRLANLRSRTLSENRATISFHESFGASRTNALHHHALIRGEGRALTEHRITAEEWPALRARHYSTINRLASRISSHRRCVPA